MGGYTAYFKVIRQATGHNSHAPVVLIFLIIHKIFICLSVTSYKYVPNCNNILFQTIKIPATIL